MLEGTEQKDFVTWFRGAYPQHTRGLRVSQNGGYKGKGRAGAIRSAKAKSQGAVKYEADIAIIIPRGSFGCFLAEHKGAGQTHTLNEGQQEYLDYHNSIGNCAISTRGYDVLVAATKTYMDLPVPENKATEENQ